MSGNPLRVALLGFGYAGRVLHAPLIRATPGLVLRSVVSSRPEAVAAAVPEALVRSAAAEALADPAVDLVVIATPNATHAPLAEAALEAGKHVVVDKPFALSLAEARRLASLARQRGRVLSVFQNRRWDADFLGLQAMLEAGRIGTLTHLESRFDRFRPKPRDRWRERADPGGGLWFDLGSHLVDQALVLFGLPRRVGGLILSQRAGAAADDWCQIQLDYGRRQVTLAASMLVGGGVPRFAAHGTAGSWIKHGLDVQEAQLLAGHWPGEGDWGHDPVPGRLHPGDGSIRDNPVPPGDYRRYYLALGEAVLGRGPNPVPPEEAVATMAVLETALAAARAGQFLPLPLNPEERHALGRGRFPDGD